MEDVNLELYPEKVMGADDVGLQEIFTPLASDLSSDLRSSVMNLREDILSPEDAAWVDSCLVKDFRDSGDDWDEVKEALLAIIDSHMPLSYEAMDEAPAIGEKIVLIGDEKPKEPPTQGFGQDHSADPLHSEETGNADAEVSAFLHEHFSLDRIHLNEDGVLDHLPADPLQSKDIGNADADVATFLREQSSLHHINLKENGDRDHLLYNSIELEENGDDEVNMSAGQIEDTDAPENIFRVWNLETQYEMDNELAKELTSALEESSLGISSPTLDSFDVAPSNDKMFDDVLAGIADLSLRSEDLADDLC